MTLKPQEKQTYCLCSVIQAILKKENIEVSQDEIAKGLKSTEKGFFPDGEIITNYLRKKGLEYNFYWYNQTPFNEPDTLLKEMSEEKGFIGFNDHTYLIFRFTDPKIFFIDPKDGECYKTDLKNLRGLMKKFGDGFFGVVKKLKE